jgi:hypothetical protein
MARLTVDDLPPVIPTRVAAISTRVADRSSCIHVEFCDPLPVGDLIRTPVEVIRVHNRRLIADARRHLGAVADHLGIDPAVLAGARWDRKAGCGCGCSPGFRIPYVGVYVWLDLVPATLPDDAVEIYQRLRYEGTGTVDAIDIAERLTRTRETVAAR